MGTVVVTGGSGKLGDAVVADLLAHGREVVNVDLVPPKVDRCRHLRVDLTDFGQTVGALSGVDDLPGPVEAVVHLAAIPAPGLVPDSVVFTANMVSTYNVFTAARVAGVRNIVWASSETVLGLPFTTPPPYAPVDEKYPGRPESAYSMSKFLGEQLAVQLCRQDPGLKIYGLRFSNVMRPEDYAAFPSFEANHRGRAWNLWGYIDARDGAQAVRLALNHDGMGAEVFVVANADTVMSSRSADLMAEVYPGVEVRHELGEHETLLSIEKACRVLGYKPAHSWRQAAPGGDEQTAV